MPKCGEEGTHRHKSLADGKEYWLCCNHHEVMDELEKEVLKRWNDECQESLNKLNEFMDRLLRRYASLPAT